ncbi:MAG: pyruvate kinase [Saprospiraceae bacterium]|nr:pyruvate kinase [Saprospiraceae bacterium]
MQDLIHSLLNTVQPLYQKMKAAERQCDDIIAGVHPKQQASAANLIHYLSLRCEDLRELQDDLHNAGLSSLASSESHALRQIQMVLQRLGEAVPPEEVSDCDYPQARHLLHRQTAALFGPGNLAHTPHLMITFDTDLADDYLAVKALIQAGMSVARINCAHDDPSVWLGMVHNIQKAARNTGQPCKIYMDLAGPKIRTVLYGKAAKKGRLKVYEGEYLYLTETEADAMKFDKAIGCTLKGVLRDMEKGDRILFDDGIIEAVVEKKLTKAVLLRIIRISAAKPFIKEEKGINFPDTELTVESLTDYDKSVIPFALQHADMVGFSFVRKASEVAELQKLLRGAGERQVSLILKIETHEAVQNLPELLLQGMKEPAFGVMIARGDLAVEIGFERLSEIQEEILWICEAGHVPVIWATQVLETLNKSGLATRSEVTDAARAAHAECIMVNKGRHMLLVLATLRDILRRSGGHHIKKRYVFRPLNIAEHFLKKTRGKTTGKQAIQRRKS